MKYIVKVESKKSLPLVIEADSPEQAKRIVTDRVREDYQYAVDLFAPVLFDSVIVGEGVLANFINPEDCDENHKDYPTCPKCGGQFTS